MFAIAITIEVGNGNSTLFWADHWIHGCSIENLAPVVFASIAPRIRKTRTVAEALHNDVWLQDIRNGGGLSWYGIAKKFQLWDCLLEINLTKQDDHHIWRFDDSGVYFSKSTYWAYLNGSTTFEPWRPTVEVMGTSQIQIVLWLAICNRF
ncbi:hypothetical protein PR202_gb02591 [Eleusine coracana subsp. coracana]|uniref:Uncharacterized protein n=1 Tax=Eleusine coracana subsp. coracana TaxID=191504 RepID=A0AAV5DZP1_ELECO|nr:hypothetical protein PR202_gb02591 [Eleusine coracana subsp. coracana]